MSSVNDFLSQVYGCTIAVFILSREKLPYGGNEVLATRVRRIYLAIAESLAVSWAESLIVSWAESLVVSWAESLGVSWAEFFTSRAPCHRNS
ncbi:hypothetical protein J6590_093505 [Homalodisca vitripennis]|nr:hypothetical protein J6590_102415 [Homalodisca vitripennis]KAG8329148.1 hypothetical protein J6590_093505 [Homalodisca vitripennis]